MTEIWKPIKGYEELYEVSNFGRVKSLAKRVGTSFRNSEKILKSSNVAHGYQAVVLHHDGKQKTHTIHRLVAEAFIKNPKNKRCVNHKKGIKTDNRASELEWATHLENTQHAWKNGLQNNDNIRKKVAQIKDGKVVKIWESQTEARDYLCIKGRGGISECCIGKRKSSGGFQWEFFP